MIFKKTVTIGTLPIGSIFYDETYRESYKITKSDNTWGGHYWVAAIPQRENYYTSGAPDVLFPSNKLVTIFRVGRVVIKI